MESDIPDEDFPESLENLKIAVANLKLEKQQFSVQRGKMKDLYIQKEEETERLKEEMASLKTELDEAKSQVTVVNMQLETQKRQFQEEMSNLQQLLDETLEQSSSIEEELKYYRSLNYQQMHPTVPMNTSQSDASTQGHFVAHAPVQHEVGFGSVLGSLARKVVQLKSNSGSADSPENLEESMRKAKEDAEVLRGLVVPLEEEITVLKDKLRKQDFEIQKLEKSNPSANPSESNEAVSDLNPTFDQKSNEEKRKICEMCSNYEDQLVKTEWKISDLEKRLSAMDRLKEELAKEAEFRKQMEEKWTEKKEKHKLQVNDLQQKLKTSEKLLSDLKDTFHKVVYELQKQFDILKTERTETQLKLELVCEEANRLSARYLSSVQLQNEMINLPDDPKELQEAWLTEHENLIKSRIGEEETSKENEKLKEDIETLRYDLMQANNEKMKLKESEEELKNRLQAMKTELENGEATQKDFVILSQNLQKDLERLRGENNVLRWEFEEDVHECRGCEQMLKTNDKGKRNCLHCGRIFCSNCLNHVVVSGPSERETKVCEVCHTLLHSHTRPYFSSDVPHSKS